MKRRLGLPADPIGMTTAASEEARLRERIDHLERERSALKLDLRRSRRRPSRVAAVILTLVGTVVLASSMLTTSTVYAMIGLGLVFWGAILLLVTPTGYTRVSLLDASALPSLVAIDQVLADLNFNGTAVYLPPSRPAETRGGTVFVPAEGIAAPAPEKVAKGKAVIDDPYGICLTPPGLSLANMLEDEMGMAFSRVKPGALPRRLEELLRSLEIAEDAQVTVEGETATVRFTRSIYNDLCREASGLPYICGSLGCPLCSSIALSLARASGEHVIIEKSELLPDGKTIEARFRLIRPEPACRTDAP